MNNPVWVLSRSAGVISIHAMNQFHPCMGKVEFDLNGQQKVNKGSEVPKDSRLGILLSFDIVLW
jgi:hypothetical protein